MAELSDQLLVVAIMGYLLAMVCFAAEYSFGGRGVVARAATRAPARELVAAAVGARSTEAANTEAAKTEAADTMPAPEPAEASGDGRGALIGRFAAWVFIAAVLAHLATVTTRGIAADRMPWGNMYEFVLTVTLVGAVGWLAVLRTWPALRHLGLYVSLVLLLLLGVDGLVLYTEIVPLVPALNSYWFVIHVSAAIIASGVFLVGFVAAALYLIRAGYEKGRRRFPYSLGARLPLADVLEPIAFRLHAFAFPIWTFAVAAGAVWGEAAWGRYWGWDPKETWAFISWVVYAGYLHARATPSVRRDVATWIAVIGWLTMLMNLFGVNLFFEGLHSYAGVD